MLITRCLRHGLRRVSAAAVNKRAPAPHTPSIWRTSPLSCSARRRSRLKDADIVEVPYEPDKQVQKNTADNIEALEDEQWTTSTMTALEDLRRHFGLLSSNTSNKGQDQESITSEPPQHPPLSLPIFISIDLEAFEFNQSKITEIGLAKLDTNTLGSLAPGPDGETWIKRIEARHIRILEHKHLVNRRYVQGCETEFGFGVSEFVSLKDINALLVGIFDQPGTFSIRASERSEDNDIGAQKRNIILVAHDIKSDLVLLRRIASPYHSSTDSTSVSEENPGIGTIDTHPNLLKTIDTQLLLSRRKRQVSLPRLLSVLDLPHPNLHNAGNDAVYTLQALVRTAIRESIAPGSVVGAVREALLASARANGSKDQTSLEDLKALKLARREAKRARRDARRLEAQKDVQCD